MKKAIALLAICMLIFSGCQAAVKPEAVPQSVEEPVAVEPEAVPQSVEEPVVAEPHIEWAVLSEEEAYTKNTVILTGQAANVRQVEIAYTYLDAEVTDPVTVFDLEISKVLACREGSCQPGEVVRVAMPGFETIDEECSYLLFCYGVADREDIMGLADYTDYWISGPKDFLLKQDGTYYLTTEWFAEVQGAERRSDPSEENGLNYRIACGLLETHIANTAVDYSS